MRNMKMNSLLVILLFLFCSYSYGQDLTVTFIKEPPDSNHFGKDSSIIYPVFEFKNSSISKKINLALKNDFKQFYEMADSIVNIRSILKESASNGLVSLTYTLLRNDNRFFSFYLGNEGEAAYPTYWETYYCFDKINGNLLTLDSLLSPEKKKQFLKVLRQKQKKQIDNYKKDILKDLKNNDIVKDDYDFALSQIKNDCWGNYSPKEFKIHTDKIEIIIDCDFPHVAQNMDPSPSLFFSLITFKQYLKYKYKSL